MLTKNVITFFFKLTMIIQFKKVFLLQNQENT